LFRPSTAMMNSTGYKKPVKKLEEDTSMYEDAKDDDDYQLE